MKLRLKQVYTYHVHWLTYAHDLKEGRIGLAQHLASCIGIANNEELAMLDAGNDTDYLIHAELDAASQKPIWAAERQKTLDDAQAHKGIEYWRLHPLMTAAVERGWIPPGWYAIKLSW